MKTTKRKEFIKWLEDNNFTVYDYNQKIFCYKPHSAIFFVDDRYKYRMEIHRGFRKLDCNLAAELYKKLTDYVTLESEDRYKKFEIEEGYDPVIINLANTKSINDIGEIGIKELIKELGSIEGAVEDVLIKNKLKEINSRLCRELDGLPIESNLNYSVVKHACHWAATLLPGYLEILKKDVEKCENEDIKNMLKQVLKENTYQYELISKLNDEINM